MTNQIAVDIIRERLAHVLRKRDIAHNIGIIPGQYDQQAALLEGILSDIMACAAQESATWIGPRALAEAVLGEPLPSGAVVTVTGSTSADSPGNEPLARIDIDIAWIPGA